MDCAVREQRADKMTPNVTEQYSQPPDQVRGAEIYCVKRQADPRANWLLGRYRPL